MFMLYTLLCISNSLFNKFTTLVAAVLMYIYIGIKIYKMKKEKQDLKPAILSGAVYIGVIAIIGLVSIITPTLYSRYLLVMTGLYIFTLSYITSKEKTKLLQELYV